MGGTLRGLDRAALDALQSVGASWLDLLASLIGLFGQAEVTAGIALGLAVARYRRTRSLRDASIPLFIVVTVIVESALKLWVPQAPPPQERARTVELLPLLSVPFAYSFPSGHVARAAFLLAIARGLPVLVVAGGVMLMIVSRLYLGEHWLSDALGGAALGLAVAYLTRRLG